jgi:hypothetical protein
MSFVGALALFERRPLRFESRAKHSVRRLHQWVPDCSLGQDECAGDSDPSERAVTRVFLQPPASRSSAGASSKSGVDKRDRSYAHAIDGRSTPARDSTGAIRSASSLAPLGRRGARITSGDPRQPARQRRRTWERFIRASQIAAWRCKCRAAVAATVAIFQLTRYLVIGRRIDLWGSLPPMRSDGLSAARP